jgi:hypothetical protein
MTLKLTVIPNCLLALTGLAALALHTGCNRDPEVTLNVRTKGSDDGGLEKWLQAAKVTPNRTWYAARDIATPLAFASRDEAANYFHQHIGNPSALTLHNGQTGPGTPYNPSAFDVDAALSFCIDRTAWEDVEEFFGLSTDANLYSLIEDAALDAAATWNAVVGRKMISFDSGRSRSCTTRPNDNITWYLRPMLITEQETSYLTFVLPPHHNKADWDKREFLLLDYMVQRFTDDPYIASGDQDFPAMFSLSGIMLRAFGNGLGFIDESNRGGVPGDDGPSYWPASCRDSSVGGIFLTRADPYSMMTHPESMLPALFDGDDNEPSKRDCIGSRPFDYALSYRDAMGTACQYRKENVFYYCSEYSQESIAAKFGPQCSPFPMTNDVGECNNSNAQFWQNENLAREYHAAVLTAVTD